MFKLLSSLAASVRKPAKSPVASRGPWLQLEALEDRLVPSTSGLVQSASPVRVATPDIAPALGIVRVTQQTAATPYTPAEIDTAYGIDVLHNQGITGAGQTIAIVDAYDVFNAPSSVHNNLQQDVNVFCTEYGLPSLQLQVQYQTPGTPPPVPTGSELNWGREAALDVEWAHVVAPAANIILFEANSSGFSDELATVNAARNYPGVTVVSMSFGSPEVTSDWMNDPTFTTPLNHPAVTFVASSGDNGSNGGTVQYPASAPNVLAVGATALTIAPNGSYLSESAWSGSGGGLSKTIPEPSYQDGVLHSAFGRGVPDVSYDGSTSTPVSVYDSEYGQEVGAGTSAAAPQWAALIALANQVRANTHGSQAPLKDAVADMYTLPSSDFHDITTGSNGGDSAEPGYDLVTGLGTPIANLLVPALAQSESYPVFIHLPPGPPVGLPVAANFLATASVSNVLESAAFSSHLQTSLNAVVVHAEQPTSFLMLAIPSISASLSGVQATRAASSHAEPQTTSAENDPFVGLETAGFHKLTW